jgi:hypothetical protein
MAKKVKAKARQLVKQLDGGAGLVIFSQGIINSTSMTGEGWERITQVTPSNYPCFVNRTYIDLAGLSRQDLTLFYQSFDIQKDKMPVIANNVVRVFEYDIISTRRLTDEELSEVYTKPPGFLPNSLDLMQCTFGLRSSYGLNTTIASTVVKLSEDTFGTGEPNAMDKLHWTRIYLLEPDQPLPDQMYVQIFPTNLVVQGISSEEDDLVWMERLRRSYVLQEAI